MKTAYIYLLLSLFCVLFGAVYELFSHEVYSFFMLYAFVFPLAGGTLPFLTLYLTKAKKHPGVVARNLHHSAVATLTTGSIVKGVLDIYGTTNALTSYYWITGVALLAAGVTAYLVQPAEKADRGADRISPV